MLFFLSGCSGYGLLSSREEPKCSVDDDGVCTCILYSKSGRYNVKYNSTSAFYTPTQNYCYDGGYKDFGRTCQRTGNWTGEQPNEYNFIEGE